ncbi:MoxR family ATPase [Verrucomicrobia bacterium]|jgi:MoxR-like ATPase|nr:MoxR family ATPase [Verrucomicrobiota bacterium]MDB4797996.1 MoxR family ATPase [Verrucomicrobiota bacterium]
MPKTTCDHCGQHIEFPQEIAGSETECPHCAVSTFLNDGSVPTIRIPKPTQTGPGKREAAGESVVRSVALKLIENIEKVIVGKTQEISLTLTAYFADGHVLLEDVPGVAKTMLARSLAQSVGCTFKRIQCTPDLLPNDITGTSIFNPKTTDFEFRPGPLFAQIVLADEINRATPRAQSALLEAMAERKVTADGINYDLTPPFILIATQNPIDHEGTFPLPEAQLDRFLIRLSLGYPDPSYEVEMLQRLQASHPIDHLSHVVEAKQIQECQEAIRKIQVDQKVAEYVVSLIQASRGHHDLSLGGSPRASLALIRCAQSHAAIQGYDFVMPDDIKLLAPFVLGHRLILKPESRLRKRTVHDVIEELLQSVTVPTLPQGSYR